ncbi:type II secretion system F family protein [Candidatus Dojkabacteria bacterium]|nr:type II secretion system F family protein [Candidatus Dojkabacteria bacterium]
MALYEYVAVESSGKTVKGDYEAKDRNEVVDFLHEKNLVVVHVDEKLKRNLKDIFNIQIGGIPLTNKVVFSKQLATMISAGLPLLQALEVLASQEKNAPFKASLENVIQLVEGGSKLSNAFAKQKGVYTAVELNLISAGEESGNLVEMIQQVADNLEKQKDFQSKVRSAMIYPAIMFVAIIGVVALLMIFMVPAVEDLYEDFGGELPWVTKAIVAISNFMVSFWWLLVFIIICGLVAYRYYYSTPSGRQVIHRLILSMPVFGDLNTKIQLAEFGRLLSMLLTSGISIIESLNIVSGALSNVHFKKAVKDATFDVEKGTPLAVPLSKNEDFPLIVSRIIATGESTGNLDKVLKDLGKYYQTEVDYMTSNLTKLMEPIILFIVGGVVAFLALVVYMPIYNLATIVV